MTPLTAYRRTGADLPFGDPCRAHGTRFEGYYWRITDAAAGRVVIALCGVCRDAAGPWAIVALATHPGGLVRSRIEPLAEVSWDGLGVRAGAAFNGSSEGLQVDLGEGARLDVALRASGGSGPRGRSAAAGRPSWSRGCRSTGIRTCSGARVTGAGWDGATVYAEKNWGPAFTEHWWWGQAQGFPDADACVAFAGGRVTLGPMGGAPTAVVVRLEDRLVALAPPFARLTSAIGAAGWRVRARSPRWRVELEGEAAGAPAVLPVPVPGERRVVDRSQQYLAGRLRVTVRRGRRVVFAGESVVAGLERWV